MKALFVGVVAFGLAAFVTPVAAQESAEGGIAWYGTWKEGLAEARRTGRPIFLISAAPHCHNVSGIW
jgi:hypothetical protein